jgi:uncharacterized cysteine cluster protein YcgN (CxxCxxCC family)
LSLPHWGSPSQSPRPYWEEKTLDEMTQEEWELLCDGCAKCCLHKIEDVTSGEILYTRVACQFLEIKTCRCRHYARRSELISDCVDLTPERVRNLTWLPASCAYRRLQEGRGLAWWHPLVSGSPETVRTAGASVCEWAVPEKRIHLDELEVYVIDWIDQWPESD